jgi:hypothetical protein
VHFVENCLTFVQAERTKGVDGRRGGGETTSLLPDVGDGNTHSAPLLGELKMIVVDGKIAPKYALNSPVTLKGSCVFNLQRSF